MADQFQYDVFLSHSSKDKDTVREVAERLRADGLRVPANVVLVPMPSYSPELTPIERLWRDLKDRLSRGVFRKLPALQGRVTRLLHSYSPHLLRSLTGYPYFVNAVNGLFL